MGGCRIWDDDDGAARVDWGPWMAVGSGDLGYLGYHVVSASYLG